MKSKVNDEVVPVYTISYWLSYLYELIFAHSFVVVAVRSRCYRNSPMVRKTFGRDEVAEDDGCIFEIDIGFPSRVVKGIAFLFHEEIIIVGICRYIKLLLQSGFCTSLSLLSYESTI